MNKSHQEPLSHRIITAIWKIRALSPEQQGEAIEKDEVKELLPEEGGSLFTNVDVKMSEIISSVLSVDVSAAFYIANGVTKHVICFERP
jgi:hypothetical protein